MTANYGNGDTQYANALKCLDRNGVYGTCSECPADADGWSLPEECRHFDRYDHQQKDPKRERFRS